MSLGNKIKISIGCTLHFYNKKGKCSTELQYKWHENRTPQKLPVIGYNQIRIFAADTSHRFLVIIFG